MSKVSADYPKYSSSEISVGDSKATTGVLNGILTSNYDMSDPESSIYNYALNTLASILPGINTFDTNTQSDIKSQVDAYENEGISDINKLYNTSLNNLENDSVSRFGNLDNSIFSNNLNDLETERSKAVSSFAQDVLSKQNSLESDELTKRYALVELLSGLSQDIYQNALKAISTAISGSSSENDYNTSLANAMSAMESINSKSTNGNVTSLLSSLLGSTTGSNLFSSFL